MSLIYRRKANEPSLTHFLYDYYGEIAPFVKRIDRKWLIPPLVALKTIEWSIYRWYRTPIRRFYGVKGNELIFMITRRCNDRCPKCGIWEHPEPVSQHMPVAHFLNCLNRLHENLYQVTLTGGEPFTYAEDVILIAREARKLNVPMVVVTNGVLITESVLRVYHELRHILVISVDTMDKDRWRLFRGRNHFDLVMNNIRLARAILGKSLRIQSVLARESEADIPAVKAYCEAHDISHNVQPYMDFGGHWNSAGKVQAANFACAARKNICIYPNGDVVKCFDHHRIPLAKEPLGNIAKEDIITILCKKRATEVSKIMKTCNFPCKQLACNIPTVTYNP
jgi:MoaA/NifB/PqqE/SkfB family radical SAM enzyme